MLYLFLIGIFITPAIVASELLGLCLISSKLLEGVIPFSSALL